MPSWKDAPASLGLMCRAFQVTIRPDATFPAIVWSDSASESNRVVVVRQCVFGLPLEELGEAVENRL
jgi:hypothetical protein